MIPSCLAGILTIRRQTHPKIKTPPPGTRDTGRGNQGRICNHWAAPLSADQGTEAAPCRGPTACRLLAAPRTEYHIFRRRATAPGPGRPSLFFPARSEPPHCPGPSIRTPRGFLAHENGPLRHFPLDLPPGGRCTVKPPGKI